MVQEAFLRVYRGLDSFHGGSSFFTWLYRIVTNLAIDLIRKPARRDAELDENREIKDEAHIPLLARIDGADPLDVVRRREIGGRIQQALDALPPYHRGAPGRIAQIGDPLGSARRLPTAQKTPPRIRKAAPAPSRAPP